MMFNILYVDDKILYVDEKKIGCAHVDDHMKDDTGTYSFQLL